MNFNKHGFFVGSRALRPPLIPHVFKTEQALLSGLHPVQNSSIPNLSQTFALSSMEADYFALALILKEVFSFNTLSVKTQTQLMLKATQTELEGSNQQR